jgi:hypothetical protein
MCTLKIPFGILDHVEGSARAGVKRILARNENVY